MSKRERQKGKGSGGDHEKENEKQKVWRKEMRRGRDVDRGVTQMGEG